MVSSLGQLCTYKDSDLTDEASALGDAPTPRPEALTPSEIKADIIAKLSHTSPREIMTSYLEFIHPWFGILSQSAMFQQHPTTWDTAPLDFSLLCFSIKVLNTAPQTPQPQDTYVLDSEHRSMYLMSKAWIALLDAAGLNSIDFVKARLLINLFEVSHRLYPTAYLSIAATVRAADALAVFLPSGASHSFSETVREEYRLMWCGIAVVDRFVTDIICNQHSPFL